MISWLLLVLRTLGGMATIPASRPCWRGAGMMGSIEANPLCPYLCQTPRGQSLAGSNPALGTTLITTVCVIRSWKPGSNPRKSLVELRNATYGCSSWPGFSSWPWIRRRMLWSPSPAWTAQAHPFLWILGVLFVFWGAMRVGHYWRRNLKRIREGESTVPGQRQPSQAHLPPSKTIR